MFWFLICRLMVRCSLCRWRILQWTPDTWPYWKASNFKVGNLNTFLLPLTSDISNSALLICLYLSLQYPFKWIAFVPAFIFSKIKMLQFLWTVFSLCKSQNNDQANKWIVIIIFYVKDDTIGMDEKSIFCKRLGLVTI